MASERFGRRQRAALFALQELKPPPQDISWADVERIDEQRLWWAIRSLDRDALMVLLTRALLAVPSDRLETVLHNYVRPGDVGATRGQPMMAVLTAVEQFYELAKRGHFFETMDYCGSLQSHGTQEFIARFQLLEDRCIDDSATTPPGETVRAIELLVDLMRRIDACDEDIVYFTDEGGSWQLGVSWRRLLPCYFRSLAATCSRQDFDRRVGSLLHDFGRDTEVEDLDPIQLAEVAWVEHGRIE